MRSGSGTKGRLALKMKNFDTRIPAIIPRVVSYEPISLEAPELSLSLFRPTLGHDLELAMELWNDHVVPDHIFLRGIYKPQLETSDDVRNSHIHFHVGQTSQRDQYPQKLKQRSNDVLDT